MSTERETGRIVKGWLRDELDHVPEPERAVQDAVRSIASMPQRRPRRDWRAWLTGRDGGGVAAVPTPPSGHVIRARTQSGIPGRQGATPIAIAGQRQALPISLVALGLAAALAITIVLLATDPRSPFSGGGDDPSPSLIPAPALALESPVEGGRDIIVAADGSGHFWTITAAVAAAVHGDRIVVRPGIYRESVVIHDDISIRGEGDRSSVVVVPADADADAGPDAQTFVFRLEGSDAIVEQLTLRGSKIGAAMMIVGGAPRINGLAIDHVDGARLGTESETRAAVTIDSSSAAVLRDNLITSAVVIRGGSRPTLERNTVQRACVWVTGNGTDAVIRANRVEASECPQRYGLAVTGGAAALVEANVILSGVQWDGIRVVGPNSAPEIAGNIITGGEYGIWVGRAADVVIRRNLVTDALTGIAISGADAVLDTNEIVNNGTGLLVDQGATSDIVGNTVCRNERNLDLRDGASISPADNTICDDETGEPIARMAP